MGEYNDCDTATTCWVMLCLNCEMLPSCSLLSALSLSKQLNEGPYGAFTTDAMTFFGITFLFNNVLFYLLLQLVSLCCVNVCTIIHQSRFLVCVNVTGNKLDSDSGYPRVQRGELLANSISTTVIHHFSGMRHGGSENNTANLLARENEPLTNASGRGWRQAVNNWHLLRMCLMPIKYWNETQHWLIKRLYRFMP